MSNLIPAQQETLKEILKPNSEVAKFSRKIDYFIVPIVFFAVMAAFHIHFMLTGGDWDFWVDWKDRQYWITVTPIVLMIIISAIQAIFWTHFKLAFGATLCAVALIIGEWANRYFGFYLWSHFPISMVWPAVIIPSALMLDLILINTRSWMLTALIGSFVFALFFPAANWYILAQYRVPVEVGGQMLTIADQIGFTFSRTATPEYLRMIERGTLRTFGGESTIIAAFFSGFVCVLVYFAFWNLGVWLSSMGWKNSTLKHFMGFKKSDRVKESEGLGGPVGEVD